MDKTTSQAVKQMVFTEEGDIPHILAIIFVVWAMG